MWNSSHMLGDVAKKSDDVTSKYIGPAAGKLDLGVLAVISDVLSVRQPFPLCPRFQTYCCLAANDVRANKRHRGATAANQR